MTVPSSSHALVAQSTDTATMIASQTCCSVASCRRLKGFRHNASASRPAAVIQAPTATHSGSGE